MKLDAFLLLIFHLHIFFGELLRGLAHFKILSTFLLFKEFFEREGARGWGEKWPKQCMHI
jgi:hypothetical protein